MHTNSAKPDRFTELGGSSSSVYGTYPFSIERADGTFSKMSMPLDRSVSPYKILQCMAESINYPPPPPPSSEPATEHPSSLLNDARGGVDQFIRSWGGSPGYRQNKTPSTMDRDLLHFLKKIDFDDIKQRRLDRINAAASVLVARRAFGFSAIDGTGLGWSSASLNVCISRLSNLHDEHKSKLRTKSFYPFRLVISSDEFMRKVDLFGGIILLNPSAGPLQWLGTLLTVTDDCVSTLKRNQDSLKKNLAQVEHALGIRVVKGYTCESIEYHKCIERLALECQKNDAMGEGKSLIAASKKASIIIESEQTCRRGKVRKDGNFEIGAQMSLQSIRLTLADHAMQSTEYIRIESERHKQYKKMAQQMVLEFEVQRVRRVTTVVKSQEMLDCMSILLNKKKAERDALKHYLANQSIGIAPRGQLCHLGDDGSIIIPANCT